MFSLIDDIVFDVWNSKIASIQEFNNLWPQVLQSLRQKCRDTKLNNNLDDSEDRDNRGGDEDASGNGGALPILVA